MIKNPIFLEAPNRFLLFYDNIDRLLVIILLF